MLRREGSPSAELRPHLPRLFDRPGLVELLDVPGRGMIRGPLRVVVALAVLLGTWELLCAAFGVAESTLPAPSDAWRAFTDQHAVLLPALGTTAGEALIGLGVAAVSGGVLGTLLALSRRLRGVVEPVLAISQTVPVIALAPLLVTWLGFGLLPKVLVVALIGFFPIVVAVTAGVQRADAALEELVRGAGAGRWRRFRLAELPAAAPAVIAGARVSALLVVPGAVAAELVGATDGLGRLLLIYDRDGRTTLTFACVFLLAALGLACWALVELIDAALRRRGLTG